MTLDPAIELKGVSKSFGSLRAVREVNLRIGRGERFVLLGHNGSGKTTLLRIAATVLSPEQGKVAILGKEIGADPSEIRRRMGIVFDHSSHWEKLSGYENAAFFAGLYGLDKRKLGGRLKELFQWLDLWADKDRPVSAYSFGMRRKLAIIEALVHDPDVILLDEPSMGLDYASRLAFHALLEEESKNGVTVLVGSNDIHEAASLGERVGVIDHGVLQKIGSPADLLKDKVGTAWIELRLLTPCKMNFDEIPGVLHAVEGSSAWSVLVESEGDLSPPSLPAIVERAVAAGGIISKIEIKRPDLGDLLPKGES